MRSFLSLIIVFTLAACSSSTLNTDLAEINGGTARFTVENNSTIDLMEVTFKITYLNGEGKEILTDTVNYKQTSDHGEAEPFIKAKSNTFFVQKAPEGCEDAKISVLAAKK